MNSERMSTQDPYSQALFRIGVIEQEINRLGAKTDESDDLGAIRVKLVQHVLTPEQAVEEAESVLARRQEYR